MLTSPSMRSSSTEPKIPLAALPTLILSTPTNESANKSTHTKATVALFTSVKTTLRECFFFFTFFLASLQGTTGNSSSLRKIAVFWTSTSGSSILVQHFAQNNAPSTSGSPQFLHRFASFSPQKGQNANLSMTGLPQFWHLLISSMWFFDNLEKFERKSNLPQLFISLYQSTIILCFVCMLLSIYKNGNASALPFLWIVFKICENIVFLHKNLRLNRHNSTIF